MAYVLHIPINFPSDEKLKEVSKMRLPTQDSATGRGIKTALQSVIGFLIGLVIVVWGVPGVPHAVMQYILSNITQVLLLVGLPSGLVSLIWNLWRKNVSNY